MAGHSHSKKIKREKTITDKKRGQMFSKLTRMILMAVKEGGPNPATNNKLKFAIEHAKQFNLPKDNIERAIKQAIGNENKSNLEEVFYEAYGPGGIAIIIEAITDNKNRTLGEIKQVLNQNNGKLVGEGAVKWMFQRKINNDLMILEWIPKQEIEISEKEKESCQKLFEELDELDNIQEIYSNLK